MYSLRILVLVNLCQYSFSFLQKSNRPNRFTHSYFQKNEPNFEDQEPKLSHYEEAQTIINQHQGYGVLSTLSIKKKINGFPSTSIVGFTCDEKGNPVFCLSKLASHTINVKKNNLVSFSTTEHYFKNANDYRISYTGRLHLINNTQEIKNLEKKFNYSHPDSFYTEFDDFKFYTLKSNQISFNSGFGQAHNLNLTTYFNSKPDMINVHSDKYIIKLNKQFDIPINIFFQRKYYNVQNVEIKRIDKYGVSFRLYFQDNYFYTKTIKYPFKEKKSPEIFNLNLLESILIEELEYLLKY